MVLTVNGDSCKGFADKTGGVEADVEGRRRTVIEDAVVWAVVGVV